MPTLTDRQRVELAIPAYLLLALSSAPGAFVPADADMTARAEADIAKLRADLKAAASSRSRICPRGSGAPCCGGSSGSRGA